MNNVLQSSYEKMSYDMVKERDERSIAGIFIVFMFGVLLMSDLVVRNRLRDVTKRLRTLETEVEGKLQVRRSLRIRNKMIR